MKNSIISALVTFVLSATTATNAFNICNVTETEPCSLSTLPEQMETLIIPGPDSNTRCMQSDGNPYFFQVTPGLSSGDKNKILLYFKGGGGCSTYEECANGDGAATRPQTLTKGIFTTATTLNPFHNWTKIFIPYCSGDLHTGNNVIEDPNGIGNRVYFNGRNNTNYIFNWIKHHAVPYLGGKIERVVIAGVSAGSIGAQYWSKSIIQSTRAFINPPPIVSVMYEGFIGAESYDSGDNFVARDVWKSCSKQDFKWSNAIQNKCEAGDYITKDFQLETQAQFRDVVFGFISCKNDNVIRIGFCGEDNFDTVNCTQIDHYNAMKELLEDYTRNDIDNNVVSFWKNDAKNYEQTGVCHTGTLSSGFPYKNGNSTSDEITVLDWISVMATRTADTVVKSSCADATNTPWPANTDYGCSEILKTAEFVGTSNRRHGRRHLRSPPEE